MADVKEEIESILSDMELSPPLLFMEFSQGAKGDRDEIIV